MCQKENEDNHVKKNTFLSIYYEIKFIPFGNGTQKYTNNNTFEPQKGCNYEQYMLKTL